MDAFEFSRLSQEAMRVGFAGEITTSTADATAQKLVSIQADNFIRVTLSRSKLFGLIPESNRRAITAPTIKLPRVSRSRPQTSAGVAETGVVLDANYLAVTFDERTASPKAHEIGMKMTKRFTWDNVEREQIERTLEEECMSAFQEDLELSAIRGNTGGSNPAGWPPNLGTTIDGFSVKLQTSGNPYWADGAYIGEDLFAGMVKALPVERRPNGVPSLRERGYAFWMPSDAVEAWAERIAKRETNAGDMYLLEDGTPTYRGLPFNGIPHFQTDINGVDGHSVSNVASSFCEVWLGPASNLLVYYNPVLFLHRGTDVETGKKLYYYFYAAMDVQIDVPENWVIARDVRPTRDTTAW